MAASVLFVTDIHGSLAHLAQLPSADLLLIGGDLTNFGTARKAEAVLDTFRERFPQVLAVSGNCDAPDTEAMLAERNCGLHLKVRQEAGLQFVGIGGCNKTPFSTPNEWNEDEMARQLATLADELAGSEEPIVLVTHAPPLGSGADKLPNGAEVGSRAVADFVALTRPALVLCGHIHEAPGVFSHEGIPVVNPGAFSNGPFVQFDAETLAPVICGWPATK